MKLKVKKTIYLTILASLVFTLIPLSNVEGASKTFTFTESSSQTQTQSIVLPKLKSVTSITTNTGSASVQSISGDNVTIRITNGNPTRSVQTGGTAADSKTETGSRSSRSNNLPSTISYNSGGYTGTLNGQGVTSSYISDGYYQSSGYYEDTGYYKSESYWDCWIECGGPIEEQLGSWKTRQVWVSTGTRWVDSSYWVDTSYWSYSQSYSGTVNRPDTRTFQHYYTYSVTVNYVDNTAPSLSVANISQSVSTATGFNIITLSGTVEDIDNNNVTILATINGKSKSAVITGTSTLKNWSLSWNVDMDNIAAGTYSNIVVNADDGLGGSTNKTYTGNILVDRTAPVLNVDFTEIMDEQIYAYIGTNKMNFLGTVSEDNLGSKVQIYYYVENQKTGEKVTESDVLIFEQENNVLNANFEGKYRIQTTMKNGLYNLIVYATNHLGLTSSASVEFEVANITSKPSVNINVNPQPTGKWENNYIDTYITDSGDFELLSTAVKKYEITNNPQFPAMLTNDLPLDRKVTLNQIGVNYLHVQYALEDGTKISSTAGPYMIDTASVGDFEIKLLNSVGNEVTDWTNKDLELFISDPSTASISGIEKQYRIESYHSDWQVYTPGTIIKLEGKNRVFGRIINGTGASSEQRNVNAMIDKTAPKVTSQILEVNDKNKYNVIVLANDQLSGIKNIELENAAKLNKNASRYSINDLVVKPTSISLIDNAGNIATNLSFANEPIVTFEVPYTLEANVYREDVKVSISSGTELSYKLSNQFYTCTDDPCTLTISMNGLFTAINTDGVKQTRKEFQIDNVDKSTLKLLLNGERSIVDPTNIEFNWNYSVPNGELTCTENGIKKTYNVIGAGLHLNGKNYIYDCYLTVTYAAENLTSNRVIIYPDSTFPLEGNITINEVEVKTNIYIEEGKIGTSYMINTKAGNFKFDKFPLPVNDITID